MELYNKIPRRFRLYFFLPAYGCLPQKYLWQDMICMQISGHLTSELQNDSQVQEAFASNQHWYNPFANLFHQLKLTSGMSRAEMYNKDEKLFIKPDWREVSIVNILVTRDPLVLPYIKHHCAVQQALVRYVPGIGKPFLQISRIT